MAERHETHDLLLVAGFAAGDLEATDRPAAEALVTGCAECSALATDLVSIARATAEMPVPRRPRDFFVSPADAERLRPHGLRRLAAAFAGPRGQVARPLAGGLMMLGFAGLLVGSLPGLTQFGAAPSADRRLEFAASPAPDSAIQGEPLVPAASAAPAATDSNAGDARGGAVPGASAPAPAPAVASDPPRTARDAAPGPSPLVVGSIALIAIGAALLLATRLQPARRRS